MYAAELQTELSLGNAAAAIAVQSPPNFVPQFPLPACLVSASLGKNCFLQGLFQYIRNGTSSPAEAVAHATLVCDTAVLEGDAAQLLPRVSGYGPLESRVFHGQVWFWSGTVHVA